MKKLSNLGVYIAANSIMYFAWGLIGPFYYLYVNELGGGDISQFGIALGIMTLASAVVSIIAGKFSDKLGRKPFLVGTSLIYAAILYSYTLVTSVMQLYVLQAAFGVTLAIEETVDAGLLGDLTTKKKRGYQVGIFKSIANVFSGVAVILGGFLIDRTNFKIIFYIGAVVIMIGTIMMLKLRETVRRRR